MKRAIGFWENIFLQFRQNKVGYGAFLFLMLFVAIGLFAPFLASSKPLFLLYDGEAYFPLLRYFFFSGFFTKKIDIFYNALVVIFPLGLVLWAFMKDKLKVLVLGIFIQSLLFTYLICFPAKDPASSPTLNEERREKEAEMMSNYRRKLSWEERLSFMTSYEKLNRLLKHRQLKEQDELLHKYAKGAIEKREEKWLLKQLVQAKAEYLKSHSSLEGFPPVNELKAGFLASMDAETKKKLHTLPTLWNRQQEHNESKLIALDKYLQQFGENHSIETEQKKSEALYLKSKNEWLDTESQRLSFVIMPLLSHLHWEDDAGGEQSLNRHLPFWLLTRINQKDLLASLIFGVRISLVVGLLAVMIQLGIGIPIGAVAGYFGGKVDIIISRILEIWEGLPAFFMLLMIVAVLQSKSIFLVIIVLGIFGWSGFSRFIRGEVLKQRNLPYIEALHCAGFGHARILFKHILPNAIPPILTLLPFAVMGAISSEAGLSFLGLGEEGSCSWGVLMDEGRIAFPGESYLLWPPATLLTILLIIIALIGDALRDAFDPKLRS